MDKVVVDRIYASWSDDSVKTKAFTKYLSMPKTGRRLEKGEIPTHVKAGLTREDMTEIWEAEKHRYIELASFALAEELDKIVLEQIYKKVL